MSENILRVGGHNILVICVAYFHKNRHTMSKLSLFLARKDAQYIDCCLSQESAKSTTIYWLYRLLTAQGYLSEWQVGLKSGPCSTTQPSTLAHGLSKGGEPFLNVHKITACL